MRSTGQLGRLGQYPDQRIFDAIQEHKNDLRSGSNQHTKPDLKFPEWNVFVEHNPALNASDDFRLKAVAVSPQFSHLVSQVVLVERLREVTALVGFTRMDAGGELTDPELDIPTKTAPLSRNATAWVPASEVRGEGIFIQFDEQRIQSWAQTLRFASPGRIS